MLVDAYTLMWLIREYESNREFYESASPFAEAKTVTAAPESAYGGLQPILVADGPYEEVEVGGIACWRVAAQKKGWKYLYMTADTGFGRQAATGAVEVQVVYRDSGVGQFKMEYDSLDKDALHRGIYKTVEREHRRSDSGKWRTATWLLPDPAFRNRQNNRTDFRIVSQGDALDIRRVTISRVGN